MINKPFFTLIIPCHNSKKTIERLLDSLLRQGLKYNDLQVILVDDASDDNWTNILPKYYNKLMYEVINTDTNVHCPSNSRKEGMKHVKGKWVCFADHDDFFEDNALSQVKDYIKFKFVNNVLVTILRSWNEETDEYTPYVHKTAWLHGKFYKYDFLKKNNIDFKENLVTHEDIYFNTRILACLIEHNEPWIYYDINTYRWVENPNSITRGYEGARGYLHENFNDYIISSSEPFWELSIKGNEFAKHQVYMSLLHCYFYYEACKYNLGESGVQDHDEMISKLISDIKTNFNVDNMHIIRYIYSEPTVYKRVREDCAICEGDFIENDTFKKFVMSLGQ